MSYTILKNGLIRLAHEDFKFTGKGPGDHSDGYDNGQMLNGNVQRQAQRAVRGLMRRSASFAVVQYSTVMDEQDLRSEGYRDSEIAIKNKNLRQEWDDVIGVNLAMALSIPSEDYTQLQEYVLGITDDSGSGNAFRIMCEVMRVNFNYNLLNYYKILRSLPDARWGTFGMNTSYHKIDLTRLAIAADDPSMVNRVGKLFYGHEDVDLVVAALLAETAYDALSQVRFEASGGKQILMTEVRSRINAQLTALEKEDELNVRQRLSPQQQSNEPDIGFLNHHAMGADMIDRAIDRIPRYQEYMEQHARSVMKQFFITLGRSHAPACEDRVNVVRRLLNDFETCGISLKELVLRGLKGLDEAAYMDTIERPGGAYTTCIRVLLQDAARTTDYPLKRLVIEETLRKVPQEDILIAARDDDQLTRAYEVTGNKTFLEHMSSESVAECFSQDIGL